MRAQRMEARNKMTDADRRSLDPFNEARLLGRYHAGLRRPVAGRVVEIDTSLLDEEAAMQRALLALRELPGLADCRPPRTSGLQLVEGQLRAGSS